MTTTVAHLLVVLLAAPGAGSPAPAPLPDHAPQQAPATPTTGVWPLQPTPAVAEGFRPPSVPYGAGHRGVDLAGRPGQVVRAAVAGRVAYAGALAGRGVVVVSHGSSRTTYEPVRATVEVGTVVAAGDPLGRLEVAGSHCAPAVCLHWGLLEADTYLDPLTLVDAGPVRLLPLEGLPAGGPRSPYRGPEGGSAGAGPAGFALLREVLAGGTAGDTGPPPHVAAPGGSRPV